MGIQGLGAPVTAQVQQVQKNEQQKQPRKWSIALGTASSAALGAWTGWDCAGIKYADRVKRVANRAAMSGNPGQYAATDAKVLKYFKNVRTKWAVIGGAAAALIGGVLAIKAEKNWVTTGKVKNAKDNPLVSQVVTTTTGQVIEIPVMLGSTTKVKALPNQKYQITHKVITPGAKAEKTIITEQELIEKFGKFDKQA